jgi:3-deoxy-D-manno-octulosonic-acid transferase
VYRFYALLLDLLYLPLLLLILPILYLKKAKYRESIPQRFAFPPCVSGTCLWIHGVSVGEIKAAQTFILLLRKHHPNLTLALSTTTTTGYHEAKRLFPDLLIFRFPFDLSLWVAYCFSKTPSGCGSFVRIRTVAEFSFNGST